MYVFRPRSFAHGSPSDGGGSMGGSILVLGGSMGGAHAGFSRVKILDAPPLTRGEHRGEHFGCWGGAGGSQGQYLGKVNEHPYSIPG